MTTFKNFPDKVLNNSNGTMLNIFGVNSTMKGPNIHSLEGVPRHINGSADFSHFPKLSFANVHKHIDYVEGVKFPYPYKGPILGFLKINGLSSVTDHGDKWQQILNKHLASSKRDAIACQRELIEKDLDEYAEF
jgi:hypothetical protein